MRSVSFPTFGFSMLALAISATAQAKDAPKLMEQVVVTATRTEQPVDKTLAPVTVFERKDIERIQPTNLVDLLRHVPGVNLIQNGSEGANSSIYIRGTSSQHAIVLVDGMRVESSTSGGASLQFIRPDDIERVEVVRGPRAALYGSDAIGGVVQIFTRNGKGMAKPGAELSVGAGSHQSRSTLAGVGGQLGGSNAWTSVGTYDSQGFSNTPSEVRPDSDHDVYRNTHELLNLGHEFEQGATVGLSYQRMDGQTEFDQGGLYFSDFAFEKASANVLVPLTSIWSVSAVAGTFKENSHTAQEDGPSRYVFDTRRKSLNLQSNLQIAEGHTLVVGAERRIDEADTSTVFAGDSASMKAGFIQYLGSEGIVDWALAGRNDEFDSFDGRDTWSGELGVELQQGLRAVGSYGTAFKAPTLNDLYYPFQDFGMWGQYQGNENLKPETSRSVEFGLRADDIAIDHWEVNIFRTHIDDMIQWSQESFSTPENLDAALIKGAEIILANSWGQLRTSVSATYLDHEDELEGKALIRRPQGFLNADVDYDFGQYTLGASWYLQDDTRDESYGSEYELGGFGTLALRGTYFVMPELKVGATVSNALEKHYTVQQGYNAEDGMEATLSVTYTPSW